MKGKNLRVHRLMWEAVNGPIPEGYYILHTCDNPPCINPNHLFLGTQADNIHDSQAKGRSRKADHGTDTIYGAGCRCALCVAAHSKVMRDYRARLRITSTDSTLDRLIDKGYIDDMPEEWER